MRLLPILLLSILTAGDLGAEEFYRCHKTEEVITLDGKADEKAWSYAAEISHFLMPWESPAAKASSNTKAKLLWDDRYLYYYAEMEDDDLRAIRTERDGELWLDDVFELFFKPSPEKNGYYEFQSNPLGTLLDIFYPERVEDRYHLYKNKDRFGHAAKVVISGTLNESSDKDTGWRVEGHIPWADFRHTGGAPKMGDQWSFTLCRYDYSKRFTNNRQVELSVSAGSMGRDFHGFENYAPIRFVEPFDPRSVLPAELQKTGPLKTHLVGTPDPPLPYRAKRVLENLPITRLIDFQFEPGTEQMIFVDQPPGTQGSRLVRLLDRDKGDTAVLFDFPDDTIYSIAFHPNYVENGQLLLSTFGPMSAERDQRRMQVKRHLMKRDGSGQVEEGEGDLILEWKTWGHTGGAMAFDDEGIFYVTTGDGTGDSDTELAGQDVTRLHGKVLRINVDLPSDGKSYSVPKDNPFMGQPNVLPETFAYGLRNPWRMTWDKNLKRLWVGNNGQDLFEQVYLVEPGSNYGWSVYEGSHLFYADRPRGPHPISPPTLEHDHGVSRSLTGGMIYSGDVLSELKGAYLYGDHSTGKIWAARHDGTQITWQAEIADTTLGIVQFNNDPLTGDLLVGHHGQERDGGGVYRLEPNPSDFQAPPFPTKLSETGLFRDTAKNQVREELLPYDVMVPQWAGGADAERYLALSPEKPTLSFGGNRGWNLPDGAVVMQTLIKSGRRLETRVLLKQDNDWAAYSYAWNDRQDDGELVAAEGGEIDLGGEKWIIPSRVDCMNCHSRAANFVLGLETVQINHDRDYGGGFVRNQLEVMDDLGLFLVAGRKTRTSSLRGHSDAHPRLVDPFDETNPDFNARVRSLLHARCSGCHRESGGGNSMMDLQLGATPEKFGVINISPNHGTQGLPGGEVKIVKPGDPSQSVMFLRVCKTGPGKMPPLGPELADPRVGGILLRWIQEMTLP